MRFLSLGDMDRCNGLQRTCTALFVAILGWAMFVHASHADMLTLYDGMSQAVTPDNFSPRWLAFQSREGLLAGPGQTYDAAKTATNVNSSGTLSAAGAQVGYSNYSPFGQPVNTNFPVLDRQVGYKVSFSVEILSEAHPGKNNRAGFSVIAVSGDVASGVASSIEIGFQDNRVFAHNSDFSGVTVENTSFDPVGTGFVDYELTVSNDAFNLSAGGVSVLSGALQDHYNAFEPPAPLVSPYTLPSLVFFGDDTTSAYADFNLRSVSVTTVPEPSSLGLLGLGFLGLLGYSVKRRRR